MVISRRRRSSRSAILRANRRSCFGRRDTKIFNLGRIWAKLWIEVVLRQDAFNRLHQGPRLLWRSNRYPQKIPQPRSLEPSREDFLLAQFLEPLAGGKPRRSNQDEIRLTRK